MHLSRTISNHNFYSFLWHAAFLAIAQNFMDVDTIIPAMIVESGGSAIHIGIMTAIMLGGSSFTQLLFAPFVSNKLYKQKYLLFGINARVLSLIGLAALLFYMRQQVSSSILFYIFLFITIFSLGGAFANVSYNDILGKSIYPEKRKTFFSTKQIVAGLLIIISAYLARKVLSLSDFPINYAFMFSIGALTLLIASGGFWQIKEVVPSKMKIDGIAHFIRVLKSELLQNKKLGYFLGFINTQGVAVTFLPFALLYAKQEFQTQSHHTGTFLFFKVLGSVLISIFVLLAVKRVKYRFMLNLNVLLSIAIGFIALFISDVVQLRIIFILGGIVYALYSITMNGLLLEVSGNENRALYTGFAGAGNIFPALFPLIAASIIRFFGFHLFFGFYMLIVACSFFFIYKINCKK